jgi:hypothetical protein
MENKTNIYQKLFNVKKEIGKLSKNTINPFYKSKYFDVNQLIEHVEPLLHENNLILLQPIKSNKVISTITDIDTGDSITSEIVLPDYQDPQKTGSAITYYRRYSLQSLLGLQAEDDDGNKTTKKTEEKPKITQWLSDKDYKEAIKSTDIKYLTEFGMEWSTAPKGMKAEYRDGIRARIKELKPKK